MQWKSPYDVRGSDHSPQERCLFIYYNKTSPPKLIETRFEGVPINVKELIHLRRFYTAAKKLKLTRR